MVCEILSLMPSEWGYSGHGWCWRYNWLLATYLSLLQPLSSTEKVLKEGTGVPESIFIPSTLAETSNDTVNQSPGREQSLHAWASFAELPHFWLLSSSSLAGTPFVGNNDWLEQPLSGGPPRQREDTQGTGRGLNTWLNCACQTPAHQQEFSAVKQKKLLLCFLQYSTDIIIVYHCLSPYLL